MNFVVFIQKQLLFFETKRGPASFPYKMHKTCKKALFPLDFPTHQKSSFILYDLICFCHWIFRPDHAIVASVGVPASTAADQRSMKLTHSPIVGIAENGSTCIKPCFFANSAFGHCVKWYLAAWFFLSYGSETLQKHAGCCAYSFRSFSPTLWKTLSISHMSKLRFRSKIFPDLTNPDIKRLVTSSCSSSTGGWSGSSGYSEKITILP